jgi:hypothetical protein
MDQDFFGSRRCRSTGGVRGNVVKDAVKTGADILVGRVLFHRWAPGMQGGVPGAAGPGGIERGGVLTDFSEVSRNIFLKNI